MVAEQFPGVLKADSVATGEAPVTVGFLLATDAAPGVIGVIENVSGDLAEILVVIRGF